MELLRIGTFATGKIDPEVPIDGDTVDNNLSKLSVTDEDPVDDIRLTSDGLVDDTVDEGLINEDTVDAIIDEKCNLAVNNTTDDGLTVNKEASS
ncbi:hypothetical protein NDU88_003874 [Pleurodeles waltl]|uniref:Uncharacterized protein n=1 Tax=Pleurodeles waltl TaxID=8319 RepID=A0AAV7L0A2_PLEWA|nr:hypothetical protein NDU88_003874 [Pleurodeles waltl]